MNTSFLRSVLNVGGLVAVGIVPMLVVVAGLKVTAGDGTIVWEPPKLPSVTVVLGDAPRREPVGVFMVTPQPAPPRAAPVRRPVRIEI